MGAADAAIAEKLAKVLEKLPVKAYDLCRKRHARGIRARWISVLVTMLCIHRVYRYIVIFDNLRSFSLVN